MSENFYSGAEFAEIYGSWCSNSSPRSSMETFLTKLHILFVSWFKTRILGGGGGDLEARVFVFGVKEVPIWIVNRSFRLDSP